MIQHFLRNVAALLLGAVVTFTALAVITGTSSANADPGIGDRIRESLGLTVDRSIGESAMSTLNGSGVVITEDDPRWDPATMGNRTGTRQGRVLLYTSATAYRPADFVETSADNRGWCLPVGKAVPGGIVREIGNNSAWRVRAHRLANCAGTFADIGPWQSREKIVRSIRILPPR